MPPLHWWSPTQRPPFIPFIPPSRPKVDKFDRFRDLPKEIQIRIWGYVLAPYTGELRSRLYSLTTYELHLPLPDPEFYRPLITTPPANTLFSRAQLAELERNPPPRRQEIKIYANRKRWEKL